MNDLDTVWATNPGKVRNKELPGKPYKRVNIDENYPYKIGIVPWEVLKDTDPTPKKSVKQEEFDVFSNSSEWLRLTDTITRELC